MNETTRLGYACVNTALNERKRVDGGRCTTGRTARLRTWQANGIGYLGDLALQNIRDLLTHLEWNQAHGITFFRIGSELIPWWDRFELKELPQYAGIVELLQTVGRYARANGHRLTFHPGPFHVLGSPTQAVVEKSIVGLERHSQMFDLMGYEPSFENKINIHIGGTYGDHASTAKRWVSNWKRLSPEARSRVVVENDDKPTQWSVKQLKHYVHDEIGIPITFDYFHHKFHQDELGEQEALELARTTWPSDVRQAVHYSESRREEYCALVESVARKQGVRDWQNWDLFADEMKRYEKIRVQAHSDYLVDTFNDYGHSLDVMLEAKAKERALLEYVNLNRYEDDN